MVTIGAMEKLYDSPHPRLEDYMTLRQFRGMTPVGMTKDALEEHVRHSLLQRAGFAIFLAGNKRDAAGNYVPADGVRREFQLARSQPRHLIPQPKTPTLSPRIGWDGVMDALLFAQHVMEMFRRSLPDDPLRYGFDRLSNRLTKILSAIRKLRPPQ